MGTTFTVSVNVKCWKVHKCVDCGCEYRYRFERKVQGQGNSERAAYDKANRIVEQTVGDEVDIRPCPTCGRMQPDMVGQVKSRQHSLIGLGTIPLVAIPIILGLTYVLAGNLPSLIVAAILAAAALLNFIIAVGNPNSNLAKNVAVSEAWIESGALEVTDPGDATRAEPQPGPMTFAHWLGLGLAGLSVAVALAPMIYQTMNNLPFNEGTKPDVVSPGDEVKVYFPDRIDCVKNYWRSVSVESVIKSVNPKWGPDGKMILTPEEERRVDNLMQSMAYNPPKATVLNGEDAGVPNVTIPATSSDATWSDRMNVKAKEKHTHPTLWAKLQIPADDRLQDKTIQVEVVLELFYPEANGDIFNSKYLPIRKTFPLTLAKKGAGQSYSTIWLGGLILGSLMSVTASFYLRSLNRQLRLHAIKPIVEQIKEDDDSDVPTRPADDAPRRDDAE